MLFSYYLKKFFFLFVCILAALIPIFASCDLMVRIIAIPITYKLCSFFLFIIPLVALFASPLAACLSVQVPLGNLFIADEIVNFYFWKRARRALFGSVAIFSFVISIFYIPLVFQWAPESYWRGKRLIIKLAQQHIENFESNKFHNIGGRATLFFKNKLILSGKMQFEHIVFMFKEKDGQRSIVTAKQGDFLDNIFSLKDGALYRTDSEHHYVSSFKHLEVAANQIFGKKENTVFRHPKFLTLRDLLKQKELNDFAWKEFHKRLIQILWQILLPFMALFTIFIFGKKRSNILISIVLSGILFLLSYVSLNFASLLLDRNILSLLFFYCIPVGCMLVFYWAYRRKW
jgi:lipopolysaccharide export LptBFGC system permease protein LptF